MKDCLDLNDLSSELRDTVGVESGVYLKEVLDRIELPTDDQIPSNDQIPGANGTEAATVTRWRIPGTRIALQKITQGPDEGAYLFTSDTVRQAAKLYGVSKQLPYRTNGPKSFSGLS